MTDDRIVRMLRVSGSDPVQQEAADEIERLRAELAAEREKTADYGKQIDRLADEIDWGEDEVIAQEKALEEIEAERDALRKLLREAHGVCAVFLGHDNRFQTAVGGNDIAVDKMLDAARGTLARIDTALNKGGGDE